jgi:8-oxo-dGTP pyrophosphatase MutT (NUDIX family)
MELDLWSADHAFDSITPVISFESPHSTGRIVEGAGGVVFNTMGRVLILRHQNSTWVFPKGHIELGESLLATALREVEEEAGVAASCPNPARFGVTRYVNENGEQRMITYFRMAADVDQPELRERTFIKGAFLPLGKALGQLSFDEDRDLLRELR